MAKNAVGRYDDITSKLLIRPGSPEVYRLIPKKEDIGTIRRLTFGKKNVQRLNKTILLVGETGSGKTTLINALVNYALGVEWEDNIWFEFVEEKDARSSSQTLDISVNKLLGFEDRTMPFSLTIIDTPGFGDTRGDEHDDFISKRMLDLLSSDEGIHELNAVGLVLKSTENRLHPRQKYIFNSALSLFGKNMENNIVTLVTHSNGRTPKKVLEALEDAKIKCAKDEKNRPVYFLFDNCQKENREDEDEDPDTLKHSDTITRKGMEQFTKFLEKTEPQRLQATTRVLDETIRLKACIENLKERVEFTEKKQREIQGMKDVLERQKEVKQDRVEFDEVYKDKEAFNGGRKWWALFLNNIGTTSCNICQENCHYDCTLTWTKERCKVIKDGNCTVCKGKCPVSDHEKGQWRYVTKTRKVLKTLEEIAEQYKGTNEEGAQPRSTLEIVEKEVGELQKVKDQLLEEAYQHVLKLEEIALSLRSVITHVHLDFLIDKMKERGFEDKAQNLEKIKNREKEEANDGTW